MRLLVLTLVSLAPWLGGCGPKTCDSPTATIKWKLQDVSGSPVDCATAQVTTVKISLAGTAHAYDCAAGKAVIDASGLPAGSYDVTAEGVLPGTPRDTVKNRARFKTTIGSCGDSLSVPVLGRGTVDVDYHFGITTATDICHGGFMWFSLVESNGDRWFVDGTSSDADKQRFGCHSTASGNALQLDVPYGTYTLQSISEVKDPVTAPVVLYEGCKQPVLEVHAIGTTSYANVMLSPAPVICPP